MRQAMLLQNPNRVGKAGREEQTVQAAGRVSLSSALPSCRHRDRGMQQRACALPAHMHRHLPFPPPYLAQTCRHLPLFFCPSNSIHSKTLAALATKRPINAHLSCAARPPSPHLPRVAAPPPTATAPAEAGCKDCNQAEKLGAYAEVYRQRAAEAWGARVRRHKVLGACLPSFAGAQQQREAARRYTQCNSRR